MSHYLHNWCPVYMKKSNKAFEEEKLRWENYIDLTTNGVAKMVGKYKGVKA